MSNFKNIFIRGLVAIIPTFVTLYLLFWMVSLMETLVGQFLKIFMPSDFYIPGLVSGSGGRTGNRQPSSL